MPDVASLTVRVDADTSKAESELSSFGSKVGSAGSSIATAFGGAAIAGIAAVAAGLSASVVAASGFESTMSAVKAVSGATAEEMSSLSGLALQLGKDTSFSASEAGKGIEELVKGGLSIPDIMNGAAQATLNLAAAGGVSLPDAATIAANALAQFNLKGEDMAHVADLIAGAANASALDVGQFKFSLQAAGAVAATVGFSFDDLAQGIAVMGKAGIVGSDAGTSLKTMMMSLSPSTKKATEEMQNLGIIGLNTSREMEILRNYGLDPTGMSADQMLVKLMHLTTGWKEGTAMTKAQEKAWNEAQGELNLYSNSFFDASGKVKSMAEVAQILQTATKDLTEEQKLNALQTIFGSDAIRAGAVLAKAGAAGFNEMADAMGKVTAEAVGAEKLNNLAGSWEQLKGSLETAAITIGLSLLPALNDLVKWATSGVNDMIPIMENLGKTFADLTAFFVGSGNAVPKAFERISAALDETFGPDVGRMVSQTLLDIRETVDIVTEAIALAFENHGDEIQQAWQSTWKGVLTDTAARLQEILAVIRLFALASEGDWQGVWSEITRISETEHQRQVASAQRMSDQTFAILDKLTGGAASQIRDFMDNIDESVVNGWRAVVDATSTAGTAIGRVVKEDWDAISLAISTAAHSVIDPVTTAWNAVKSVTDTIFAAIKNVLIAVWDAIYDSVIKPKLDIISTFISDTWETIRGAVETKINATRDLLGIAWDAVSSKAHEVLDAVLTYVRDTIFEPIRAAVETKINAARDLFASAVQAVSDKAHAILDPILSYWRDTIWEPIRAAVDTAMYGPKGAFTQFESAVNSIKGVVDTTLGAIKSVWETTWTAIQTAAESPKAAMDVLIKLVKDLKSIMPEWLIPHSPTPFQVGLEGIIKAAREMSGAFGGIKVPTGELVDLARRMAEEYGIPPDVFTRQITRESNFDPGAVNPNSGAAGLGQFMPGTAREIARALGMSIQQLMGNPANQLRGAAYYDSKMREMFGGDITRMLAAYNWGPGNVRSWDGDLGSLPAETRQYLRDIIGLAQGGIVTRPTLTMIGEAGPEAVIPLGRMRGGGDTYITIDARGAQVYDGPKFEDLMVRSLERAGRRGRIVQVMR